MCHEATSVGLPDSIGVGKGTCLLEDFDFADAIFIFGQNPGTNSPRMMTSLRNASRRGARIISFNPFRERALERFQAPQSPIEMTTLSSTPISQHIYQVRVGGDVAALKGMMKALIEADDTAIAAGQPRVVDIDFIKDHTLGFETFAADLRATGWEAIERQSGLTRADLNAAAATYMQAPNTIIVYGMGITQHRRGTQNVQQLANLALLRGNVGRPGAGICPVRGHSNVQGDRTVGITEKPAPEFLARLEQRFGFAPPADHGHDVVTALEAMLRGEAKVFIALGGNFAAAISIYRSTLPRNSIAAILSMDAMRLSCLASAAPRSTSGQTGRNRLLSRIRCRWSMRPADATSQPRSICAVSPLSSLAWHEQRWAQSQKSTGKALSPTTTPSVTRSRMCFRSSRIITSAFACPAAFT
jgi:molybdopterin-dependent oxidoreductase alpha subunit